MQALRDDATPPPVRLFKSDALERLTHTSVATILGFWIPIFVLCLGLGIYRGGFGAQTAALLVIAGAGAWTLFEYLLHRFGFHIERWIPAARPLAYLMHGCHHEDPGDASRDIMPLIGSVPIFAVLIVLAVPIFGAATALTLLGGFGFAYLGYDLTHYACHQRRWRGRITGYLKRHHLSHHYADGRRNFGVTSPLWDVVFGTLRRSERRRASLS
jgi:sterol desaturase/sphingolipid hydroxylase (fatty acid hydroxylase superfamily)